MYFNRPNLNTLSQHTHAHIVAGVTGVYILSANKHADKSLANNKKWNESSRSNDSVLHALLLRVWVCVCLLFLTFFLSLSLITPGIIVIKITRYTLFAHINFLFPLYNLPQIFPRLDVLRLKQLPLLVLSCCCCCLHIKDTLFLPFTQFTNSSHLLVILPLPPV